MNVKGIIFDYGGTIDNAGDHWAVVIREAYATLPIPELPLDTFCAAYVFAERELARVRHILPEHNFRDMMRIKARLELEELRRIDSDSSLNLPDSDIELFAAKIADYTDAHARTCIDLARPTLDYLYERYPMVLVSNFYGNIGSVLKSYRLEKYFRTVIESAVAGVRKPDPAIFRLGLDALSLMPEEVVVVGDSISKDILPARSLGCKTICIQGQPWFYEEQKPAPGVTVRGFSDLSRHL